MSIWDDAEIRTGGEFIKFDAIGDTVTGTITAIRKHTFDDGKAVPQLFLDVDGEERTLTAGQVRLKAELAIQRPEVGDTLTVTLANVEKRAGGKTLKHFDVSVVRGGATPAAPAPAAAPPVAAPAITDQLTDQQRQALASLGL